MSWYIRINGRRNTFHFIKMEVLLDFNHVTDMLLLRIFDPKYLSLSIEPAPSIYFRSFQLGELSFPPRIIYINLYPNKNLMYPKNLPFYRTRKTRRKKATT